MTDTQGGVDLLEREFSRILADNFGYYFDRHINNYENLQDIFLNTSTALLGGNPKDIIMKLQTENIMEKFNINKQPQIKRAIKNSIISKSAEISKKHQQMMMENAMLFVDKKINNYFENLKTEIKTLNATLKHTSDTKIRINIQKEIAQKASIVNRRDITEVQNTLDKISKEAPDKLDTLVKNTNWQSIFKALSLRYSKKK